MKKLLFLLLFSGFVQSNIAQDTSSLYLQHPTIPPFKIYKVPDSTAFAKEDLKAKRPLLLIFFSPDCEHCQHEMKELLAHKEDLKNIQVLMVSPMPYEAIKVFYETYQLDQLPNFTLGQDRAYLLGTFFKPRRYPSLYLYNKKGKFIKTFDGNADVKDIMEAFQ